MFRPVPMSQVDVLLMQKDIPLAVRELARAGILHLQPVAGRQSHPASAASADLVERCSSLADCLRDLLKALRISAGEGAILDPEEMPAWERQAAALTDRIARLERRRAELQRHHAELLNVDRFLGAIADEHDDLDLAPLHSLRAAHFVLCLLSAPSLEHLREASYAMLLLPLPSDTAETLTAILVERRHAPALEQALKACDFRPLHLPPSIAGSPVACRERLRRLLFRIQGRLARLQAKLHAIGVENRTWLLDRLATVEAECSLLRAGRDFDYTDRSVILSGWLPQKSLADLKGILHRECAGRFALRQRRAHGERIPVQFANPALIRPFEKVLSVYGVPSYEEIEPTPLLAVGFLLMFGMMFGDVGQGLLLVALGLIFRKWTRFHDQGLLVAEMGGCAAVFGFLFGSCFGSEKLIPPLWFSPLHNIPLLMGCALLLGVVLLLTGLSLRVINELRRGHLLSLLTDRLGLAGLLFYGGAVLASLMVFLASLPASHLGWLLLPLGAIFLHPFIQSAASHREKTGLLLIEGAVEVLETVLGFLANTFSFLRVAAFGLAHVGLSMAVFAIADAVKEAPLGLLWVATVHVAGNAIIVTLEGLVVSVQTVRLEFYEFFSKFFRGEGVPYRPLSLLADSERRL